MSKSSLIFGPIVSRRFGISLGIDLSPDSKSCNFDCLYCELLSAKKSDTIINPPAIDEVLTALKRALGLHPNSEIITITANGEPTLYPYLDKLIDELNKIKQNKKLLILSNGSTIYQHFPF
jgi:wyosine [tRNA(Phe)-imidazoG37] synthetase (radical SAM superfamily)